jgi:hypothetical protein
VGLRGGIDLRGCLRYKPGGCRLIRPALRPFLRATRPSWQSSKHGSPRRKTGSLARRRGSGRGIHGSGRVKHGSGEEILGSVARNIGSARRKHGSGGRKHGSGHGKRGSGSAIQGSGSPCTRPRKCRDGREVRRKGETQWRARASARSYALAASSRLIRAGGLLLFLARAFLPRQPAQFSLDERVDVAIHNSLNV